MLGYQSTWVLQAAIVALEDRSLDHAGSGLRAANMQIITVNTADTSQRFALASWTGAKIGMGTRQEC
jgi:hypothetical protein